MDLTKFESQVFFTTVRITIPGDDNLSSSVGTGFIISMKTTKDGFVRFFLVSNKHVFLNKTRTIILNFHKKNESDKTPLLKENIQVKIDDFSEYYFEHENKQVDLACMNITGFLGEHNPSTYHKNLHKDFFNDIDYSKINAGNLISFVGYPSGLFDTAHNLPILRKGYIASIPSIDFNDQKIFLIDAQVFQGSSGSPTFTIIEGKYKLLGIISSTYERFNEVIEAKKDSQKVKEVLGLGIVIKTELMVDMLEKANIHFDYILGKQ